jgi:hypothetical protein
MRESEETDLHYFRNGPNMKWHIATPYGGYSLTGRFEGFCAIRQKVKDCRASRKGYSTTVRPAEEDLCNNCKRDYFVCSAPRTSTNRVGFGRALDEPEEIEVVD